MDFSRSATGLIRALRCFGFADVHDTVRLLSNFAACARKLREAFAPPSTQRTGLITSSVDCYGTIVQQAAPIILGHF